MDYSDKTKDELIALCKERGIKGYSNKKKDDIIELLCKADSVMSEDESDDDEMPVSEELDALKATLENKEAQRGLLLLYQQSQMECTRNGVCGMEIGMAREKDLGAVLKYYLGDMINLDLSNDLPEDFCVGSEKISVKHSSGKVGQPVKAKWTAADKSVQDDIQSIIHAKDEYYPNLLFSYLDVSNNMITIICITAEHNKTVIKSLEEDAFKVPKGNSRGIEYSRKAMDELLKKPYFTIKIKDANLKGGMNPIERRMKVLESIGIKP